MATNQITETITNAELAKLQEEAGTGNAKSMKKLAEMYFYGKEAEKDLEQAIIWLDMLEANGREMFQKSGKETCAIRLLDAVKQKIEALSELGQVDTAFDACKSYRHTVKFLYARLGTSSMKRRLGQAWSNYGLVYKTMENYAKAAECYEKAAAIFKQVYNKEGTTMQRLTLTDCYYSLMNVCGKDHRREEALSWKTLAEKTNYGKPEVSVNLPDWQSIVDSRMDETERFAQIGSCWKWPFYYDEAGKKTEAIRWLKKQISLLNSLTQPIYGEHNREDLLADCYMTLAGVYKEDMQWVNSLYCYTKMKELREHLTGVEGVDGETNKENLTLAHYRMADILYLQNNKEEALKSFRKAEELMRCLVYEDGDLSWLEKLDDIYYRGALAMMSQNQLSEARTWLEKSLEMRREKYQKKKTVAAKRNLKKVYTSFASLCKMEGKLPEAEEWNGMVLSLT